ncbi:MAG: hypothetical protein LAO56_20795 [Acidobacteriia bacterium]|nr:hypothetical protein [Terriglobia bacterium]
MRDIDQIIRSITQIYPAVTARQLSVSHPGVDDDGLWFFQRAGSEFEVQIESSTGMVPFLIETDESDARLTAKSINETLEILTKLLHLEPQ